jgi:hypothetical protein
MNTATASIEQQAKIREISGNVQLVRDGFFLPAQAGMTLLPGDRIVTDQAAKAVIHFTGINDALVVEQGSAATFNLELVEMDAAPQWIATNLQGEGVYFDSQPLARPTTTADTENDGGLFGLFGAPGNQESTGYPILESLVFLGATAAIYSDNDNNTAMASASESGNNTGNDTGGNTTPPPTSTPPTPPETETEASPLDAVLAPLTDLISGLIGNLGGASPLGSQAAPLEGNNLLNVLNQTNQI